MRAVLDKTPHFGAGAVNRIAEEYFGICGNAQPLPSERDQNFFITTNAGDKFVLKIANALESREFLEAQNAALKHVATQIDFCQSIVPATSGDEIATVKAADGVAYFVRVVRYLPGVPLGDVRPHPSELLNDLGRKLGRLDQALKDFDHPAVHRNFHWDLANGNRIVDEYAPLVQDSALRDLVLRCRIEIDGKLRRSVIHGDPNDYNVLVDPERMMVTGLLDFGDMIYSYTVGNLAIAIAYVVLDKSDPVAAAREVVRGYTSEFALLDDERIALWPLVRLRLAMSVCLAAHQQRQQPDNEYLRISQQAIQENLARIYADEYTD